MITCKYSQDNIDKENGNVYLSKIPIKKNFIIKMVVNIKKDFILTVWFEDEKHKAFKNISKIEDIKDTVGIISCGLIGIGLSVLFILSYINNKNNTQTIIMSIISYFYIMVSNFIYNFRNYVQIKKNILYSLILPMDIASMCNINMMFFAITILISIFVSQEFRSGYTKCLFTVRSNKVDYVISKTLIGFVGGAMMILAFFIGSLIGGAIAGTSFELVDINILNIIMSLLSKIGLVLVFDSIFLLMSIVAKEKLWLSLLGGLGIGMLMFMMISIVSPLNATFIHVVLAFVGGGLFAFGIGAISNLILKKTKLI